MFDEQIRSLGPEACPVIVDFERNKHDPGVEDHEVKSLVSFYDHSCGFVNLAAKLQLGQRKNPRFLPSPDRQDQQHRSKLLLLERNRLILG